MSTIDVARIAPRKSFLSSWPGAPRICAYCCSLPRPDFSIFGASEVMSGAVGVILTHYTQAGEWR